ncbi:hypothetical protein UA08_09154 [Talaromyces atroroseus]|uniref:Uncharacterized protein n=1 Tax=Talaromyces atroroseus TaxID=1441469 RepID=A0A1Q5Q7B0_TALAT|nr:hypothetical protein UA08_09154 [Talaromyces atroroseus]OKL55571.1 hypothetical protein UA08_09154 [Talaromyces atroroseus]
MSLMGIYFTRGVTELFQMDIAAYRLTAIAAHQCQRRAASDNAQTPAMNLDATSCTPPPSPRPNRVSDRISSKNNGQRTEYRGSSSPSKRPKRRKVSKDVPLGKSDKISNVTVMDQSSDSEEDSDQSRPGFPTPSLSSFVPTVVDGNTAMIIMTGIMWNCVKRNSLMNKYGRHTKSSYLTTKNEDIIRYVDETASQDYHEAVRIVKRDNAFHMGRTLQHRYKETVYWDIIRKGARLIDPATLPTSKGPLDGFTPAEKVATQQFMDEVGFGVSPENQRLCRTLWKSLYELRQAGICKTLYYRTKEFDNYCQKASKRETEISLVETIKSWDNLFGPHLDQIEARVARFAESSSVHPPKTEGLDFSEDIWNQVPNKWWSAEEAASYQVTDEHKTIFLDITGILLDPLTGGEVNKAIFMSLTRASDGLPSVRPMIPIDKGDILGIFAGMIRFTAKYDPIYGIPGPIETLWLDYSQVTGTLNHMKVSQPGGDSNVQLCWNLIRLSGESRPSLSWIVSVQATKRIMPFEELVREAPRKEQYLLHRSPVHAKRGFTKV